MTVAEWKGKADSLSPSSFFMYAFPPWLLEELHYVKVDNSLLFVSGWNNFQYLRHPIWQRS